MQSCTRQMARLNCAPSEVAGSYSKKYLTSPLLSEDGQQNYSERKKRDSKFADPHWSPRWREKIYGWASLCSRWKEKISDCASLRYRYQKICEKSSRCQNEPCVFCATDFPS